MTTLSALCIFAGDNPQANPDAAAEALRAAGYQVFRLPPELHNSKVPGDDFIEVHKEGDADEDAMWADAQRVVDPFGGDVDCVGPASEELFLDLLGPSLPRCAHCKDLGTPDRVLWSVEAGKGHVLLHRACLRPWIDALMAGGPRLDRCAHCRELGTPDRPLLSIDVGGGERDVLLHNDCRKPWLDVLIEGDEEAVPF
jgi:hypothetical protein